MNFKKPLFVAIFLIAVVASIPNKSVSAKVNNQGTPLPSWWNTIMSIEGAEITHKAFGGTCEVMIVLTGAAAEAILDAVVAQHGPLDWDWASTIPEKDSWVIKGTFKDPCPPPPAGVTVPAFGGGYVFVIKDGKASLPNKQLSLGWIRLVAVSLILIGIGRLIVIPVLFPRRREYANA